MDEPVEDDDGVISLGVSAVLVPAHLVGRVVYPGGGVTIEPVLAHSKVAGFEVKERKGERRGRFTRQTTIRGMVGEGATRCPKCSLVLAPGADYTAAGAVLYHPECFVCVSCSSSLLAGYFDHEDGPKCGACHGRELSCVSCGEAIEGRYLVRDGARYHASAKCAPRRVCEACESGIAVGEAGVSAFEGTRFWHTACFTCQSCTAPLTEYFLSAESRPICGRCFDDLPRGECGECHRPILGVPYQVEQALYHLDCLRCQWCRVQLTSTVRLLSDGSRLCAACSDKRKATLVCKACRRHIDRGNYVEVGGDRFHNTSECLACSLCKCALSMDDVYLRGEDIVCEECA
jgi:hypothetical protein